MRYKIPVLTCLLLPIWAMAQTSDAPALNRYQQEIINNPSIGRRCDLLDKKRKEKLSYKHKLDALIFRNRQLYKQALPKHNSVRKKLERNYKNLKYQQRLAQLEIQNQQEEAVRKGCYVPFLL